MPPNLESLYLNFNSRLEMDMQDIDEHTREFGMDITNRIHATTLETTKSSIWSHSESVNKPQKEEIPFIDQIMEYLKETDVRTHHLYTFNHRARSRYSIPRDCEIERIKFE